MRAIDNNSDGHDIVEIVITPTEDEYRQVAGDLQLLRQHCGTSNTVIILAAVHEQADRLREPRTRLKAA